MRSGACEKWIALSDRDAIGAVLTADDRVFLRMHETGCAACASESSLYAAMPRLVDAIHDVPTVHTPAVTAVPRRRRALVAFGAAAAAVLAAAASLAVVLVAPEPTPPAPIGRTPTATLFFAAGDARVDGRPAEVGQPISSGTRIESAGPLCLRIEPAIHACLAAGGALHVVDLGPQARLFLESGRLVSSLAHRAPGTDYTVATRDGTVTAIGTVFAVEVETESVTRVLEGRVRVRAGEALEVGAGESHVLGGAGAALSESDRALDAALLAPLALWDGGPAALLAIETDPAGAEVEVDGTRVGTAPVALFVRPGPHGIGSEGPGVSAMAERIVASSGERVTRSWVLRPLARDVPEAARPRAAAPEREAGPTPGELLRIARAHRAVGELREAADTYRELQRAHPGSAEAHTSLVSLGDLQVSALGDAAGAIRSFDAYLASPGGLAQEARRGRIRALAALGRYDAEARAIEAFLADYPASVHAPALRDRLRLLSP